MKNLNENKIKKNKKQTEILTPLSKMTTNLIPPISRDRT